MGEEYFWGVDLYFISCARELCMGGNIVGVVDLYFISRVRKLCMGGNIFEAVEDLKMHFYRAAVL